MKSSEIDHGQIGERVLALRLERGWSQQKLAKKMNVARTTIGELESGQTSSPAAETLLRLADALDVDPWMILYGRPRSAKFAGTTPIVDLFRLFAAMPPLYQDLLLRFAREMAIDPLPPKRPRKSSMKTVTA